MLVGEVFKGEKLLVSMVHKVTWNFALVRIPTPLPSRCHLSSSAPLPQDARFPRKHVDHGCSYAFAQTASSARTTLLPSLPGKHLLVLQYSTDTCFSGVPLLAPSGQ